MKRVIPILGVFILGGLFAAAFFLGAASQAQQARAAGFWLQNQALELSPAGQENPDAQEGAHNLADSAGVPQAIDAFPGEAGVLNYQGRLLLDGEPYNGAIPITFTLWTSSTPGAGWLIWQEQQTVTVTGGLFSVMLGAVEPLDDLAVSFQSQLWLGVQPQGAPELAPRQPLATAAYAMNLLPGATLVDNNEGGPYGYSFYVESDNHPAIFGGSNAGPGVQAYTSLSTTAAIRGINYASSGGKGIYGEITSGTDPYSQAAIYGRESNNGTAVLGEKTGPSGVGVFGTTEGGSAIAGLSQDYVGAWGQSATDRGVYGRTDRQDNNYGLYTADNLYSLNFHTLGARMQIVQNGGSQPLEPGDLVVFHGITDPLEAGGSPIIQVALASDANSTAVAGVVYAWYDLQALTAERTVAGPTSPLPSEITAERAAQPGEHLLIVVQGPARVKAGALNGAIQPGDLLAASGEPGLAGRASEITLDGVALALPGTVFAKALEALAEGQGYIYVFVTLQ